MRYLLIVSYDGSEFHGFQRQKNAKNVQSELENALSKLYNEEIKIKGAGRTDAKVHAYSQCVHFDSPKKIKNLKRKLNSSLNYIKVKKIINVKNDFHARYSVKEKIYIYKLSLNNKDNSKYYGIYYGNLNFKAMKEVSKIFEGTHNFKNFVAGYRDDYESTIFKVSMFRFRKKIYFIFKGHGFYRYMVRNIVGAIIDVGKSKVTRNDIQSMLDNYTVDKRLSTAKAEGLYLKAIKYNK